MLAEKRFTATPKLAAPVAPGTTIWLTGLSGAGKTTIARELLQHLQAQGQRVELLDGDVIRQHLAGELGFSYSDRCENVRRIGFLAELLNRHGVTVVVASISPYREMRHELRQRLNSFLEVYVNAPLATCEKRDVKGLYRRARSGEIPNFTGISDPYEAPLNPDLTCFTDRETVQESVAKILTFLKQKD
jgi:adenylyl-sulfate kinase